MNSYLTSRGIKSVWISERTDGRAGSGSATDPFNGGTPDRFDKLMVAVPEGWEINILGWHATRGCSEAGGVAWSPKSGWRMIFHGDAGLKLVDATFSLTKHFVIGSFVPISDFSIIGGTLDADAKSNVQSVFGGIALTKIERFEAVGVNIINTGTFGATQLECFAIVVAASKSLHIDGVRISGQKADAPSNGGWKGIECGGGKHGLIERVEIIGDLALPYSAGIGVMQADGFRIKDCQVQDCTQGVYNDTFSAGDLEISDNQFINCVSGVRMDFSANEGTLRSCRILRNRIVVRDAVGATAVSLLGHATRVDPPSFDTVIARDNFITAPPGKGVIGIKNARYFEAVGNFFDCEGPYLQVDEPVAIKVTSQDVWANYNNLGEIV